MKKVSKESVLLFGVVLALSALVMPSMASAASWSPVGTTDGRMDSSDLGFFAPALNSGSVCRAVSFNITVDNAAVATVTAASFGNCVGNAGSFLGCTLTATGTNFPWRATATATHNIQIHGVDIDVAFEPLPGTAASHCANNGVQVRLTGTVTNATFTPSGRRIDFGNAHGLTAHVQIPAVSVPAVPTGSVGLTGLLNVLD